jgi:hypothetical protein
MVLLRYFKDSLSSAEVQHAGTIRKIERDSGNRRALEQVTPQRTKVSQRGQVPHVLGFNGS